MRFIFQLCDRVACLVRGVKLVEGDPGEVQSDPRVVEAYIGGSAEEPVPDPAHDATDDVTDDGGARP